MSNINQVRHEVISANQDNILRSYTRLPDGHPLHPNETPVDELRISFETSDQGIASWQTFLWRNGSAQVTVHGGQNAMENGGEGQVGIWEPAIDGVEGFNVEVALPQIITLSPLPGSVLDWNFTISQGFYKITVPWDVSGERILQEFAVSVRE